MIGKKAACKMLVKLITGEDAGKIFEIYWSVHGMYQLPERYGKPEQEPTLSKFYDSFKPVEAYTSLLLRFGNNNA